MEINYQDLKNIVDNTNTIDNCESEHLKEFLEDPSINFRLKETFDTNEYFEPKDGEYAPKGSLWNNPLINKIRENLTPEQLKYFEAQGSKMYDYDYVNADIDSDLKEITEYVICGLRSGLSPSDMTDDEKDAMCEIYGPTWYIRYGFTEEEVYGDD